eukprot:CAMPEP_0197080042 /NCGR_PEP_ID=MMETSP1384-20130603/213932_1 /TAXON_ID=29189 /ORGANISM="Ammonia sp." /LENGTH=463 /DNA_ID=CAMNT_0042518923 /DNA_START=32 /DNA_END=1423 /DNA_ORIENTATION=-
MSTVPLDRKSSEPLNNLDARYWYLYGEAHDFSDFISRHPGGQQAICLGRGRDCTALFESYHTRLPSKELLSKYKVKPTGAATSNNVYCNNDTFTFNEEDFYHTLKRRAVQYFERNNYQHTKGGCNEIFWWIVNVLVFVVSGYFSFCMVVPIPFVSAVCAIIWGVSKSLMVIRSTHGASHYAFSNFPRFNRFVYWFNMCLVGDTPQQWTAKHVLAHHIDTNITPIDDDTMYPIKRVLSSYDRYWYHAYQHVYIWFLYFFVYLPWTISHNIKFIYGALFNHGKIYESVVECYYNSLLDYLESVSCIIVTHCIRLLPFFCLPTWTHAIIIALIAEFSSSVWFSLQFAVNHEVLETVDNGSAGHHNVTFSDKNKNRDFGAHQMITSHNYSVGFWPTLHLSGGLNYQIEHHLFPSVHYKHYPELGKIVESTAKEFNLPYTKSSSFMQGVWRHCKLLYIMGNNDKPLIQ